MSSDEIHKAIKYLSEKLLRWDPEYVSSAGVEGLKQLLLKDEEFSMICEYLKKFEDSNDVKVNLMQIADEATEEIINQLKEFGIELSEKNINKIKMSKVIVKAIIDACEIPEECGWKQSFALMRLLAYASVTALQAAIFGFKNKMNENE